MVEYGVVMRQELWILVPLLPFFHEHVRMALGLTHHLLEEKKLPKLRTVFNRFECLKQLIFKERLEHPFDSACILQHEEMELDASKIVDGPVILDALVNPESFVIDQEGQHTFKFLVSLGTFRHV